jgi:translation initiation factor 1 (eIF-1/SUI1)
VSKTPKGKKTTKVTGITEEALDLLKMAAK